MMNGKCEIFPETTWALGVGRGTALLFRSDRDRAAMREAGRLLALTLGTLLFVSGSALLTRANKIPKPMASVAADCARVVAAFKSVE